MTRRTACAVLVLGLAVLPAAGWAQQPPPPNVAVTPALKEAYQEPSMAADPLRPGHLALAFQAGNSLDVCLLAQSFDGGVTWSMVRLIGNGGRLPLPDESFCWNPTLRFGPDGSLYYTFQTGFYFHRGDRRALLTVSRDGGATFLPPVALSSQPDENQFWPALAVDPRSGRVYGAFTRTVAPLNGAGPIAVVSSDDGGRTFSPPLPPNPTHVFALGSVLAVAGDGRLYIGYLEQRTNPLGADPDYVLGVSADGGRTFRTTSLGRSAGGCLGTSGGFDRLHADGPCRLIALATGSRPGEAYATWWDERGPQDRARVVLVRTTDGGLTWSTPRIVAVPVGRQADHQHRPWPVVTPDGRLHIAFFDREGQKQDGLQHVYLATSADGGVTFAPARRLSSVASDSRRGPTGRVPAGFPGMGDFLAAVPAPGGVAVAWPDLRRASPEDGKQDIYFTAPALSTGGPLRRAAPPTPAADSLPTTG